VERYRAPTRTPLPRPTRLPPVPELGALQRGARAAEPALAEFTVEVADLAPARDGLGVATFRAATGGDFRWQPLAAAEPRGASALALSVRARRGEEIAVTLASASDLARHGYLNRRVVIAQPGAVVRLSGARHEVRFDLPDGVEQAGPLRLQRVDDRDWLPMEAAPAGLKLQRGARTSLQLGAGRYELQDPLASAAAQVFEVPAQAGAVTLSRSLARAPDGRR